MLDKKTEEESHLESLSGTLARVRHAESTGILPIEELSKIQATIRTVNALVNKLLVARGASTGDALQPSLFDVTGRPSANAGTKWGVMQPYFGRFRLDTSVEHLVEEHKFALSRDRSN